MALPDSYQTISMPAIRLSHHPPSSPSVTPIILVILNRPAHRNAFTTDMVNSLEHAFGLLSSDPRVRCIVLTGSDPANRTFCAGLDLSSFSIASASPSSPPDSPPAAGPGVTRETHRDGGGRVSLAIFRCQKPVIAAINGDAVGVGITATLPCDMRVVSSRARVGFVFARRGLVLEACSSFFLPRLVGWSAALRLVATGRACPAADPLLAGLWADVVDDPARVLGRALELAAETAASCSAVSVVTMRHMVYRNPGSPEGAHLLESKLLYDLFRGRDFREGVSAFLEKRPPELRGTVEDDAPSVYPWWEDELTDHAEKAKL